MSDEVVSSLNKPTRRESALGKNVSVRDLSTNSQLYVSWGIVTNVYYKKGTLDFKTSLMNASYTAMEKHTEMSGSAKIPVDFWGNDSNGKPFGSYRPVSVGNRILVAYIGGKTSSPVVLGVYPDNETSYELISPAIDKSSNIDGTTDEIGSDLATKKVYPSGQIYYQSGKGELYRLFNGKSYFTINSNVASRINNGIERLGQQGTHSDDSSDTSKSVMAGDWSLVHEDNTEKDSEGITDSHYTRVYLNRHGKMAIITTDKDSSQVVSMIEVSQGGGITMSKTYDGIGNEGIPSSIYTKLTVGDKDKTTSIISSDGTNTGTIDVSPKSVSVNGKPIANTSDTSNEISDAVSGITKEWTDQLADEISKVQDEVQKANQDAINAANNAQQTGNQAAGVAEAAKQAASAAQEVANEAQTAGNAALVKANSAYDTGTQAQKAADNAQAAANSAASIGKSAQEAADSAQQTGSQAEEAAESAKKTASAAQDAADEAQTVGSDALTKANSAYDTGTQAQAAADTAQAAADSAASIGKSAQEAADNAQQTGSQAKEAAESAKKTASAAQNAANEAQTVGSDALTKANSAYDTGTQAQKAADNAQAAADSAATIGKSAQESADSVAAQAKKNAEVIEGLNSDAQEAQRTANSATQQANSAFDKANKALDGIQGITSTKSDKNVDPNRIKGVTLSPSSTMTFDDFSAEISDLQVNTVTFQIRVIFTNAKDSNPTFNVNDYAQVESFLKKLSTLDTLPKVLIEPLPVVSSGYVSPKNYTPTDVSSFFDSWTKIVSSIATMVNQYNVYGLYIGYAFDNLESYTDNWKSLISTIKPIFSGQLLYMSSYWTTATWDTNSNNKYQAKLAYPLWGMVDIIAIAPYFEVTDDAEPTPSDLEGYFKSVPLYQRGQNIYQEIKNFYDKWKKPILLGDVGIPAYSGAAQSPYNGTTMSNQGVSGTIQEAWLEAWYVTFEGLDWFKGINSYCIGNQYDSYNYDSTTSVYSYWKKTFYYEKSVTQSQIVQLDDIISTKVSDKDFDSTTVQLSNQISTKVEQNQYDLDMTAKSTGVIDPNRVKGGNLSVGISANTSNIIDSINTLKLNSITLPVQVDVTDTADSSPSVSDTALSVLENSIKAVQTNDSSTKVMVKLYPIINKGSSSETSWEPSNVDTWFTAWGTAINKLSLIAAKYNVYGIYVGSNLANLETYSNQWDTLITSVRNTLKSLDTSSVKNSTRIIYQTNYWVTSVGASDTQTAYQNKLNNPLFGYVDVIAISSYFEITDKANPSVQDIKDGIYKVPLYDREQNIYQEIKNFYDKWNKPIMFGELGIPPYDQAARAPYQTSIQSGWKPSDTIQHNWLSAWYQVFAPETWFLGFSLSSVGDSSSNYYVQSGDIASFLAQLNLYQSTVSQTQITQLVDDIDIRVQKGDVINQINVDSSGILIDGSKTHITGKTEIDDGVIKTAMIGDLQVTDAKIDTLTADKLTAGTIDASVISVTNLNASNITSGTISASKVVGGELDFNTVVAKNLTADSITSGTIDFSKIEGTNIDATNITTGNLNASLLTTGTIDADLITTGTLDASKITVAKLSASSITTGTLDASKVTVTNLDATNITSGTISASKVVGGELDFDNIVAKNLTADSITSGIIDFSKIKGTNIDATNITTGNLNASLLTTGTIDADLITTGTLDASKVTVTKLSASIITTGTLDANKVTVTNLDATNITTGTMSASKIIGGELDFNNIVAKNLNATSITSGKIDFSKIEGTNIDATNITTGNLNASLLTTGTIDADLITTGTLDASKITVAKLSASSITTGTLDASKVTVSNIDASNIVTGTLDASVVNVINLNASNINAGTLTADLIKTGTFDISQVKVENFSADLITTGTLDASKVKVTNLTADTITSGTLDASKVTITNLDASNITTGTLDASKVMIDNLSANSIVSGTLDASKIAVTNLKADAITSGTLDAGKVNVTNLDASNITTGTLSGNYISGGTISGTTISGGTISGGTITGSTLSLSSGSDEYWLDYNGFHVKNSGVGDTWIFGGLIDVGGTMANPSVAISADGIYSYSKRISTNGMTMSAGSVFGVASGDIYFELGDGDSGQYMANVHAGGVYASETSTFYSTVNLNGTVALNSTMNMNRGGAIYGDTLKITRNAVHAQYVSPSSQRSMKKNIYPVDSKKALHEILVTPVYNWNFKSEPDKQIKHTGPIINDIDNDPKYFAPRNILNPKGNGINLGDISGVLMASIQELARRVESLEKENKDLRETIK